VVKDGWAWNDHPEKPFADTSVTCYRARMTGGVMHILGSFPQTKYKLIDASSASGYPHLYVSDFIDVPTGSVFKTAGGVVWHFNEMANGFDARASSNWVGGTLPYYYLQTGFGQVEQFPFMNYKALYQNFTDHTYWNGVIK
jgi:hypothetical protein